jgi:ATP-binding cassette subfamily C protein CydCD
VWGSEWAAARTGARAKSELRAAAVDALIVRGEGAPPSPSATTALVTRGVDALDGYYARYLPQLVLAVIVPVVILAVVVGQDVLSAVVIALTLPLIPVFMVLIGLYTRGRVERQWSSLTRLNGQFLDFVEGLPTLMVFGRAKAQASALREGGERYRRMTMGVLRISFLSSLVLELLAALAVALVAVEIGLRLVSGGLTLTTGLFVLILAPEAYLPLRLVGTHYHAAAEGLGAADEIVTLIEGEGESEDDVNGPMADTMADHVSLHGVTMVLTDASVTHPGRIQPSLWPVSFTIGPGRCLAIVGGSGVGKSTLLQTLAGERRLTSGTLIAVSSDGRRVDLGARPVTSWRSDVVLVGQQPVLIDPEDLDNAAPSVRRVVAAADPDADAAVIDEALTLVGLTSELRLRGDASGASVPVATLSAGQQRRVALARAHVTQAPLLLLDEPTAGVDPRTEESIVAVIDQWRQQGRTLVVVAHRPAILEIADGVLRLPEGPTQTTEASEVEVLAEDMLDQVSGSAARSVLGVGW